VTIRRSPPERDRPRRETSRRPATNAAAAMKTMMRKRRASQLANEKRRMSELLETELRRAGTASDAAARAPNSAPAASGRAPPPISPSAGWARKEIERMYAANNPEKLPEVDMLLSKYGDRKLLGMVRKKYGVQPPRKEIEALYAANNPEKLSQVDSLLEKYGECELLRMVRKKYGVVAASPSAGAGATATSTAAPPSSTSTAEDSSDADEDLSPADFLAAAKRRIQEATVQADAGAGGMPEGVPPSALAPATESETSAADRQDEPQQQQNEQPRQQKAAAAAIPAAAEPVPALGASFPGSSGGQSGVVPKLDLKQNCETGLRSILIGEGMESYLPLLQAAGVANLEALMATDMAALGEAGIKPAQAKRILQLCGCPVEAAEGEFNTVWMPKSGGGSEEGSPKLSATAVKAAKKAAAVEVVMEQVEAVVPLRRDSSNGFGLDLADDGTVAGLREGGDAVGRVAVGSRIIAVDGRPTLNKRQIAAALMAYKAEARASYTYDAQRPVAFTFCPPLVFAKQIQDGMTANVPTQLMEMEAELADVLPEQLADKAEWVTVHLGRHPLHGFGLDLVRCCANT
jgi:hypothetical protein